MIYTDDDLADLIGCAKRVSVPPKREMRIQGQMLRNEAEFESLDGKHTFRAYMRQSRQFPENFSIGLEYRPKDEPASFCLIRCNGMHGGHKIHPHHLHCHVHRSQADDVNTGLRVERHIEATEAYAAYRDALRHFLLVTNVQASDLAAHFPGIAQADLFTGEAPL